VRRETGEREKRRKGEEEKRRRGEKEKRRKGEEEKRRRGSERPSVVIARAPERSEGPEAISPDSA
jgi:hypothetical protein